MSEIDEKTKARIIALYHDKSISIIDIAKRFSVSVFTIRKVWRDAGLPPRKSSPVY